MAKLLRISDKILLGLSLVYDVLDSFEIGYEGSMRFFCEAAYGRIPKEENKNRLYVTVYRMVNSDLIEKVVDEKGPRFRVTSNGKERVLREFPLLGLQRERWDKKWRFVSFDVPEKIRRARDVLREKLRKTSENKLTASKWEDTPTFWSPTPLLSGASGVLSTKFGE